MATATTTPGRRRVRPAPSLNNGDRLTQPEFHRRYERLDEKTKAELIGGIVYMASPLGLPHGLYHVELGVVFGTYKAHTPGVEAADNATTILNEFSEPQPDLSLRILPAFGGQTRVSTKYLTGAPELMAEIAQSSHAIDLHLKKDDYERAGVLEYIVLCIEPPDLHWFRLQARREVRPNAQGIYRSRVFPGLWIDGPALLARNTARLIEVVHQGLSSAEHAAFLRQLNSRRQKHT